MPVVERFDGPIVDVGSGGGSPGIPLAAALPEREVTLLEAERRKCDFLAAVGAAERARRLGPRRGAAGRGCGVALAKALAQPPVAAEWCLPLVRLGGAAILWLGESADLERARAQSREQLGGGAAGAGTTVSRSLPEGRADAGRLPAPGRRGEEASAGLATIGCGAMSRIYALANQKGGVGKTTTAVNLAACLAEAGERALVIDLDPQANATSGLGMRANGTSSYDLLDGAPLAELVKHTAFANLDLVPAKPDLAGAVVELAQPRRRRALPRPGARVGQRRSYDFVFLDCPPSLGPLTVNALAASDRVLVPVQAEYYALEGLAQLMQSIELIRRRLNPSLGIGGVLLTMVDAPHAPRAAGRGGGAAALRRRSSSARPSRARCASPRRRATACPRLPTTVAPPEPTPTGRWRWSLSSAPESHRAAASAAASKSWSAASPDPTELLEMPVDAIHPNPKQPRTPLRGRGGLRARRVGAAAGRDPAAARAPARRGRLRDRRRRAALAGRARGGPRDGAGRRPRRPTTATRSCSASSRTSRASS